MSCLLWSLESNQMMLFCVPCYAESDTTVLPDVYEKQRQVLLFLENGLLNITFSHSWKDRKYVLFCEIENLYAAETSSKVLLVCFYKLYLDIFMFL